MVQSAISSNKTSEQQRSEPPKSDPEQDKPRFSGGVRVGAEPRFHLKLFFQKYPEFAYDPNKPFIKQFYCMVKELKWKTGGEEVVKARHELRVAMYREFNNIYGIDGRDKEVWRNLFSVIDNGEAPSTVKACRKLIRTWFINICDLIDKPVTKRQIKLFLSEERLSKNSKRTKKRFPLSVEGETKSGLVDPLLRFIDDPEKEDPALYDSPDVIQRGDSEEDVEDEEVP